MYKYLCYSETLYAFLQYLLINKMDIENTLFIFSESMNKLIGERFKCNKIILNKKKGSFLQKKKMNIKTIKN